MKTVAICNAAINSILPGSFTQSFLFKGDNMILGVFSAPETEYKDKMSDHSVVVKIKAFSCNYRDRSLLTSFHQKCNKIGHQSKLCYAPFGSDFVGEVIKCGKSVKTLKTGDRVIPDSAYPYRRDTQKFGGIPTNYASQRIHVFDEDQLAKIPDSMPDETAASFTIAAQTTYSIFRKLDLKPHDNVLVTAPSSNTSLSLIRILQNTDVNIYVLASNESRKETLLGLGVAHVLTVSDLNKEYIYDLTSGKLFNAVFDPFYDVYMEKVFPFITFYGKYITCGLADSSFNSIKNPSDIIMHTMVYNISIIGNCLGTSDDLQQALNDFEAGKFDMIIDSVFSGNDIIPFIKKSFGLEKRFGKVVYKYQD